MNNDLEQFSEERLMQITQQPDSSTIFMYEVRQLARIALSVKQAKPMGYTAWSELKNTKATGLYFKVWPKDNHAGYSTPIYLTPQPAHTEQTGWISIPKEMLADYRDVKNGELQTYKASFGSHCDIPRSRWQKDLADLTEELAEIDKLIAAAPKPESE